MSDFKHKTLESPTKQIRLVQLLPRHCEDKGSFKGAEASRLAHGFAVPKEHDVDMTLIRCSINQVSLDDKPKYTAMSYTWGAPERSHRIMINDADFQVTESLEIMLQHIQSSRQTLTLWIDQLCIDQDNYNEKKAQVGLMKKIYQEAIKTIIWLGPAADDSDQIMEFLADVGREAYGFDLMQLTRSNLENWSGESDQDQGLQKIKNSLNRLLEKVWVYLS
jgi:Heterokaryon incompatibility protein (HET)